MTGLDIFTFIVMAVLLAVAAVAVAMLGAMPGKIARRRAHPQAEAIMVGGWVTLIAGAVLWPVVLIWAYLKPPGESRAPLEQPDSDPAQLTTR